MRETQLKVLSLNGDRPGMQAIMHIRLDGARKGERDMQIHRGRWPASPSRQVARKSRERRADFLGRPKREEQASAPSIIRQNAQSL
jgi:hypothetical protein